MAGQARHRHRLHRIAGKRHLLRPHPQLPARRFLPQIALAKSQQGAWHRGRIRRLSLGRPRPRKRQLHRQRQWAPARIANGRTPNRGRPRWIEKWSLGNHRIQSPPPRNNPRFHPGQNRTKRNEGRVAIKHHRSKRSTHRAKHKRLHTKPQLAASRSEIRRTANRRCHDQRKVRRQATHRQSAPRRSEIIRPTRPRRRPQWRHTRARWEKFSAGKHRSHSTETAGRPALSRSSETQCLGQRATRSKRRT